MRRKSLIRRLIPWILLAGALAALVIFVGIPLYGQQEVVVENPPRISYYEGDEGEITMENERLLFTMDAQNYGAGGRAFSRPSARAIVIENGRVAMVYSQKYGHYKFPGGGIERGESREAALLREAREEAGLVLDPASIRPYGFVHRIEKGDREPLFLQDNFYYLASASAVVPQELDGYEAAEGYTLRWVTPGEAIEQNRALTNGYKRKTHTELLREAMVLERLQAEGLV